MNPWGAPVVILACGGMKGPVPAPALDLYRGPFFAATRRWAESVTDRDRIYVLSALHGLIPAAQVVEPYDTRLTPARAGQLAELVHRQAAVLLEPCTAIEVPWFCGGRDYLALLRLARVSVRPVSATLPPGRATRGIGAQRSWYIGHLGTLPAG
jgi:uncharacterized protein DUF6884